MNSAMEIIEMLNSDDYLLQKEAIENAPKFKEPEIVDRLIDLFIKTNNKMIEEHITEALKQIGGSYTVEKLLRLLDHEEARVRVFAFEVLSKIGNDNIHAIIKEAENPDKNVRKFVVDILGALKNKEAVDTLLKRLSDDDVNVVQGAIEALGNIGDVEALKKVIEFLPSAHLWVQWTIIESIKKVNNRELISEVLNLPWEIEDIIFDSIFDMVKENGTLENVEDAVNLYLKLSTQLRIKVLDTIYSIYIKSDKQKVEKVLSNTSFFDEIKTILIYGSDTQKFEIFNYMGSIEDKDFVRFIKSRVFDETVILSAIKLYYASNTLEKRELVRVFKYFNKSKLVEYMREIFKGDDNILKLSGLKIMRYNGIKEAADVLPEMIKEGELLPEVLKTVIELNLKELFDRIYEEYFNVKSDDLRLLMLECMVELRPDDAKVVALIKDELANEYLSDVHILKLLQLVRKINDKEPFRLQLEYLADHPNIEISIEAQDLLGG
ncbi:HEAT repeat protein [Caldicellulosiruptor bescii]|uniref:PBS lyase HEAT domain protein repeat-containing protein n=2 Tax=Caldicellulosiruptor bescii TaxID=31899 RepID=B9MPE3_CALBD|nr:HEAT repeat domain-containing protein [Caldicellulosiruptor bescii]ACM59704.1 PBS lyase HEAT domain protein repeat-containing protein [Caldicellulosiruptor bescii DSM 6725]PBC89729.1 HEAT repeat protein [Caldicellulosiruptor bescii]PBC90052.1 HEAT repeat protein [Caldicellulosiruptor bescii]PBD04517.1 HEAT repeat protein [Caldicellulosiruptor bescii]PBD05849.1 HEAT repeat protein [Caldicellulosiruptor bescii]